MNALFILLVAAVILVIGYVCYGGWLAKQWGVDPKRPTPAHELEDGVDYVPAPPYVVLGHHFSSIAGAGPINGPIQAAVFGWVPVLLWVLIGGIFFGAMHDFGSLFASLRHKGQTLAVVVAENIDNTAKKLFCIFAYLTLLLVVAAFASIVANTFAVSATAAAASNLANEQTAMISIIFIGVAVVYGFLTRGRNIPGPVNIVTAIILIIIMVAIGYNLPLMGISLALDYNTWMIILGVYILIASVAPVWILLQPRDYLSSYLLYGMIILAVIGIVGASLMGAASNLQIPAFTGFVATNAAFDASTGQALVDEAGKAITNKAAASGFLFPALFITIACGAISGFHSLVASGTTSKQLDKESQAQPSVTAACSSSACWPSSRCAPSASCGASTLRAATLPRPPFSLTACPRCSRVSPAWPTCRVWHTRCSSWLFPRSASLRSILQPAWLATCSRSCGRPSTRSPRTSRACARLWRTPTLPPSSPWSSACSWA